VSKKSKIEPKRKTVTSAPPPVPRIRGGYIPPKDIPPNYEHWNRFPIMSVREAIFLTIGIEPRASQYPEERKNKARFLEIDDIVQSHVSYGSLKLFRRGIGQVSVSAWMDWLQMVGMSAPPEWRPVTVQTCTRRELNHNFTSTYWRTDRTFRIAAQKAFAMWRQSRRVCTASAKVKC
jgi:hypothetical protein